MSDIANNEIVLMRDKAISELGLLDPGFDKTLDQVVDLACSLLDVPMGAFTVMNKDRLFFKALRGTDTREMPAENSFSRLVIEADRPLEVTDASTDVRFKDNDQVCGPQHVRFYTGYPIHAANGIAVGALCVLDQEPRQFTPQQMEQFDGLRILVEETLRLRSQSLMDPLTGLYNRRYLKLSLAQEWQRAGRQQLPLSILMIDVDHFKDFNDTYGHSAGDTCLLQISELMHGEIHRPTDVLARFGGEEFVILLPETDFSGMELVAANILKTVRSAKIPHRKSPSGHLTVSIGGATIKPDALSRVNPDGLLKAADRCLYGAKATGRNNAYFTRVDEIAASTE